MSPRFSGFMTHIILVVGLIAVGCAPADMSDTGGPVAAGGAKAAGGRVIPGQGGGLALSGEGGGSGGQVGAGAMRVGAGGAANSPDAGAMYLSTDARAGMTAPPHVFDEVSKPAPGRVHPVVFLEVGKGIPPSTGAKVPGKLKIVEDHDGKFDWKDLAALTAKTKTVDVRIAIGRHGNASDWYSVKKSYNIELQDDKGMDLSMPLVGLPSGSDWVLYACYNDKTCLRNVISYDLGRQMGHWAPRTRFVEVVLDGKYIGLYTVVERIRRDKDRVNIPKLSDDPAAPDLSGGYIWKVDSPVDAPADKHEWQTAGGGLWWAYQYPKWDQITEPQRKALQSGVAEFEAAIKSPLFADPKTGYASAIDVRSFVDYLMIHELSYNVDGIWRSSYFHKQSRANGNKVFAGPLWDFDLAYGNATFRDAEKPDKGWQHVDYPKYLATVDPADLRKYRFIFDVFAKLFNDPEFQRQFRCRWKEMRANGLDLTKLNTRIDDWVKENAPAVARDRAVWPVDGKMLFGATKFQTYAEDINYIKGFIAKRVAWMDSKLPADGCTL